MMHLEFYFMGIGQGIFGKQTSGNPVNDFIHLLYRLLQKRLWIFRGVMLLHESLDDFALHATQFKVELVVVDDNDSLDNWEVTSTYFNLYQSRRVLNN